jgi:hypothetical protein
VAAPLTSSLDAKGTPFHPALLRTHLSRTA